MSQLLCTGVSLIIIVSFILDYRSVNKLVKVQIRDAQKLPARSRGTRRDYKLN